jgi:hypothetical protein
MPTRIQQKYFRLYSQKMYRCGDLTITAYGRQRVATVSAAQEKAQTMPEDLNGQIERVEHVFGAISSRVNLARSNIVTLIDDKVDNVICHCCQ